MKIYFNHKEELWNSWSHGAGIVLGLVVGTALLVWPYLYILSNPLN